MSGRIPGADTIRSMDSEPTRGGAGMLRGFRLAALVGVAVVMSAAYVSSGSAVSQPVNGRIAFVLHSDLFTIRPDGRGQVRLTSGRDVDGEPAWSPGGRWLAFSRTSRVSKVTGVYLVGERGGKPRLLLRGARSPAWSPNGRRLAVIRTEPGLSSVWTVGSAGRDPRRALAGASDFDWSPSGHELAGLRSDGIWIVRVASGTARKVSSISGTGWLDWSPDGSRLLLLTSDGIVTVSVADGAVKTLRARQPPPAPGDPRPPCSFSMDHPAWSPDGRWIAYEETVSCPAPNSGGSSFASMIQIISADGVWHDEINNLVWGFGHDGGPSDFVWSPDSRFLAFMDDSLIWEGCFLATAEISVGNYEKLKGGLDPSVAPAWQRSPAR